MILVQVYVDDIIFGSTSYKLCKQFEKLMTKKFEMSMMGERTYFLGLQIKQTEKGISISQENYTRNLLKKYDLSDCASVKSIQEKYTRNSTIPNVQGLISKDTQTLIMQDATWIERVLQAPANFL